MCLWNTYVPCWEENRYLYLIHLNSYSDNAAFKRIQLHIYMYTQMVTVLDTMSKY